MLSKLNRKEPSSSAEEQAAQKEIAAFLQLNTALTVKLFAELTKSRYAEEMEKQK